MRGRRGRIGSWRNIHEAWTRALHCGRQGQHEPWNPVNAVPVDEKRTPDLFERGRRRAAGGFAIARSFNVAIPGRIQVKEACA